MSDETPVHVVPEHGREHQTDGTPCWCKPELVRAPESAPVVVHREAS
jgi:hypothetical protein